jgi:PKD repeat protein
MNINLLFYRIKFIFWIFISSLFFGFFISTFAIDLSKDPCGGENCLQAGIDKDKLPSELNDQSGKGLKEKIVDFINYALTFIGILLLIVVIYAGILLIFSNGESESLDKPKKMILYALLGVIVIVLSYAIVNFIANIMSDSQSNNTTIETPSNSGGSSGGNTTTIINKDNKEYIDSQINSLMKEIDSLKNGGSNNENTTKINQLQKEVEKLEKEKNDNYISLENKYSNEIEDLKKEIINLESKPVENNSEETNDKIKELKESLILMEEKQKQELELIKEYKNQELLNLIEELKTKPKLDVKKYIEDMFEEIKNLEDENKIVEKKEENGYEKTIEENNKKIEELKKQLGLFNNILENKKNPEKEAINKEIIKIYEEIENLEKSEENNPESSKKIEELRKKIEKLDEESSILLSSSEESIEDLLFKIKNLKYGDKELSKNEIDEIKEKITILKSQSSNNEELTKEYTEIENLVKKLENNPEDEELKNEVTKEIIKKIEKTKYNVISLDEIIPKILMIYSRKTVPTTITLSGENTYIRGDSLKKVSNESYHWSVVSPDGVLQNIGIGINKEFSIDLPGRYLFTLSVDSPDEKTLGSTIQTAFTAEAQDTEVAFQVGEKSSRETLNFTKDENEKGIIFNPSLVKPKIGRKIVRYLWNFDGYKVEEKEGKPVVYSFPNPGKHRVMLEVIDNTGKKSKSQSVYVEILKVVSYFKFNKEKYSVAEEIEFSAKQSKSDNGFIQEFDWQIINKEGVVIKEFQDEFFRYAFTDPGTYVIRLTIKDSKGGVSSSSGSLYIMAEPPVANFSVTNFDKSVPGSRVFDASKTLDPADSNLLYSWDFDGDGVYDIVDNKILIQEHVYAKTGNFNVKLKVTNEFGKNTIIRKMVNVPSILTAKIETSNVVYPVNEKINFTAKTNEGKAFEWNFGDGTGERTTGGANISYSFNSPGQYIVELTANDDKGNKTTTRKSIFIGSMGSPIGAIEIFINDKKKVIEKNLCGEDKNGISVYRSDNITFSGEKSINKDGKTSSLDYLWGFPNDSIEKKSSVDWRFFDPSEKGKCEEVSFHVEDIFSGKSSEIQKIYFFVLNSPPKINSFIASPPKTLIAPVSVPLKIKAEDNDGKIIKYSWWAERKGFSSKEKIGFHVTKSNITTITIPPFGDEGETHDYTFFATVEDNDGLIVETKKSFGNLLPVSIKTGKNKSPKVDLIVDKTEVLTGDSVVFTANVKTQEGDDISNLASFKWDFDGDNVFDDISNDNMVAHKYMKAGKKTVRVKVLYQGLSTSKIVKLFVTKLLKLPLAKFLFQKTQNGKIRFNARGSKYDETIKGNAIDFIWDFDLDFDSDGDGVTDNDIDSKNPVVLHEYPKNQKKSKVRLTIRDATNSEDIVIHEVIFDKISGVIRVSSGDDNEKVSEFFYEINSVLQKTEISTEELDFIEEELKIMMEDAEKNDDLKKKTEIQNLYNSLQNLKKEEKNGVINLKDSSENMQLKIKSLQKALVRTQKEVIPEVAPLVSDYSVKEVNNLTEVLDKIEKAEEISEEEIKQIENVILSIEEEIDKDDVMYEEVKRIKDSFSMFKNDKSDFNLKILKSSINEVKKQVNNSVSYFWKSLKSLGENINKSLVLDINTPSTTLDVYGGEKYIKKDEEIDIFAFVQNSDGSYYTGDMKLTVIEGTGIFNPLEIQSLDGRGITKFTPTEIGVVKIEISALNTVSGEIKEYLTFFVQE